MNKFDTIVESVTNPFKPQVKNKLKNGEELPTRDENFKWFAELDKNGVYSIFTLVNKKYYKVGSVQAEDSDEVLRYQNDWIEKQKGEFMGRVFKHLSDTYGVEI